MGGKNQTLEFHLEQDIARFLVTELKHRELTFERASQIARFILAHLPENLTDEQVMQILPTLDDEFVELGSIVYTHLLQYEEQRKQEEVKHITDLIKHSHFEQASSMASEYFKKKIV